MATLVSRTWLTGVAIRFDILNLEGELGALESRASFMGRRPAGRGHSKLVDATLTFLYHITTNSVSTRVSVHIYIEHELCLYLYIFYSCGMFKR